MSNEKINDLKYMQDWYIRAAEYTKKITGGNSTAAKFLEYYLTPEQQEHKQSILKRCKKDIKHQDNNHFGENVNEEAGTYIFDDNYLDKVKDVSEYNAEMNLRKQKFLSEEKTLSGIIKHIQDDEVGQNEYSLSWYSSVGLSFYLKNKLKALAINLDPAKDTLTPEQQKQFDVYTGLNTFTIKSDVIVKVNSFKRKDDGNKLNFQNVNKFNLESINVSIKSWKNTIYDYYDFNGQIGFYLINPDYGKKDGLFPDKLKITPLDLSHKILVNLTKENPPLAREFYIFKEFNEDNPNLLVENYDIKWRES